MHPDAPAPQVLLKFIARRPTRAPHQRYAFVSTSRDEGLRLHLPDSKTKPHLTVKAVLYGLSVRMRAGRGATADAEDEVCFHVETIECGDVDFMCTGVEQAKDWVLGLQLQLQNVTEGEVMRQRAVLVDAGMSPFKVGKAKPIKNKATTQERKFRRLAISAETSAEMKANEKRRKESLTQVQYVQKVIKKSEDASARIRAALKGNFLFSALKGKNLSDLVLAMEEVQVVDGEVLIQQGDKGDNFYVVENGEYEVLVDDNKVAKLGRGASFGELALMYNCPRAATIRAAGPGSVWQVDRSTFVHLVVNASMGSSEAQFLREVALFQHVKEVHLLEVAAKMERKNYNRNAVIEKEGQEGTCMYIVFSGEVEVGSRKSGKWVSYKTYSRNDFLGERALMTGGKRQAEIRAKTACKLLVLDKPQYENLQFALEEPLTDLLKMDCLQSIPALQALTGTQLGEVVDEFKKREVSKGEVIIKQGALCKELSIIRSGSVIEKKTGTTYGAWKAFGEQGLVENSRATSNFEAQEDCVLLYLEQDAFTHMIGPLKEVMTRNVNLKILQSVPLFESLSEVEMMTVADSLKEKDYTKGEHIVKQNDHGHDMYILKTGEVVVTKSFGEGEPPKELVRMKEGSFFGERALLTNEPRAANIVASKRCKCYSISREVFEKSLGSLKEIMEAHTKKLEERKQELNLRFTDLKIMRTIGMGQFGRVKIVQHKITKACYALKCLRKAAIFEAGQEEHIRMERVIMNKIGHHPFIMKLVRSFKDKAQVYMLLELTPGGELFKYLDESELGYFPEAQAKFYAACVVSAFEQMHGRNVLYRDLVRALLLAFALSASGFCALSPDPSLSQSAET